MNYVAIDVHITADADTAYEGQHPRVKRRQDFD